MLRRALTLVVAIVVANALSAEPPTQLPLLQPASKQQPLLKPVLPGLTKPEKSAAPAELPQAVIEQRWRFDPNSVEVKLDGRRWILAAGKTTLKDFGEQRSDAYEARRLLTDLNLNEHGVIGTPEPVMEFWLKNGEAPPAPSFGRNVIPFDPSSLRIAKQDGAYYVRDARQILFNFGPYESDANMALGVLKRYGFNEIGFIGSPRPAMSYLIKSDRPHLQSGLPDKVFKPEILPQQSARFPLSLPRLGTVGERTPIDVMRVDLQKAPDGWHLVSGPHDLALLGHNEYAARQSLLTLQRYPLNEFARIGTSGFGFYLSRGRAPQGVPVGVRRVEFDPKTLAAKQVGDEWVLSDGKHVLATFQARQGDDAKMTVKVLQYYGFDSQCEVAGGLRYLAKDR